MPEVSQRQCGRHLSKSYRVLASRHAKLHSIKMTPFLLVNQKSFHVDEPPDELVRVYVCVRQSFNCQKTRRAWKINNICRDCLNRFDKAHKSVLCKTICSNEKWKSICKILPFVNIPCRSRAKRVGYMRYGFKLAFILLWVLLLLYVVLVLMPGSLLNSLTTLFLQGISSKAHTLYNYVFANAQTKVCLRAG